MRGTLHAGNRKGTGKSVVGDGSGGVWGDFGHKSHCDKALQ